MMPHPMRRIVMPFLHHPFLSLSCIVLCRTIRNRICHYLYSSICLKVGCLAMALASTRCLYRCKANKKKRVYCYLRHFTHYIFMFFFKKTELWVNFAGRAALFDVQRFAFTVWTFSPAPLALSLLGWGVIIRAAEEADLRPYSLCLWRLQPR